MFDILRKLIHDVEVSVRRIIGTGLAGIPETPRDLAILIANDDISIAYPILTQSNILHDHDLIEVIRHRTLEHQLGIAIRQTVSEGVSDALVETGNEGVIGTLLQNPNARISNATMEYLVEASRRVDTFQEPILRRHDLDPALARRMFMWVSAALRHYILDNYELDQSLVDEVLERAALGAIEAMGSRKKGKLASEVLVAELEMADGFTPELLLRALQAGNVHLFVAMFRQLTGLRENLIMRIIFESGGEGLAIACKSAGIGKAIFSSIFALTREVKPDQAQIGSREMRHVLILFDQVGEDSAKQVVRLWQRNVGYLAAIRELQLR